MCNNIPGCLRDGSMNRASMVCVSGCEDITCKDVVDISNVGKWKKIAPMITSRAGLGLTAASNGKIYAVGGIDATGKTLKSAEVYDPKSDTWSYIADMSYARFVDNSTLCVAIDDKIYAVGGVADGTVQAVLEVYDPNTNKWTLITPLTSPAGWTTWTINTVASLNGILYATFSLPPHSVPGALHLAAYIPTKNEWVSLTSPPGDLCPDCPYDSWAALKASDMSPDMSASYPGGLLYLAGSQEAGGRSMPQVYDPSTDRWHTAPFPGAAAPAGAAASVASYRAGMAALYGKIYIVGGHITTEGYQASNQSVYDPSINGLINEGDIARMTNYRQNLGLTALNGKLYAVGGVQLELVGIMNTGEVYTPYPS
jgi:hypothetical protein